VKLIDPPGSDVIVLAGVAAAAIGALVATGRWLVTRSPDRLAEASQPDV
jgi:hypothetical protein